MSGFSAEWLALREPADVSARSSALATALAGPYRGRLLDLGGGTGANIRYLSSRLAPPQQWMLVDDDPRLLAHVPAGVTTIRADLNAAVRNRELFRGCSFVTASALLDLVSEDWLSMLVAQCRAANAAVLFALNYDGRIVCSPEEPEDGEVRSLVNAHQRTDKGFGPALGPDAAARTLAMLTEAGYATLQEQSDWMLAPDAGELQRELVAGWASAASDMAPARKPAIDSWRSRRYAHIDANRSRIIVGHLDVAGIRRA